MVALAALAVGGWLYAQRFTTHPSAASAPVQSQPSAAAPAPASESEAEAEPFDPAYARDWFDAQTTATAKAVKQLGVGVGYKKAGLVPSREWDRRCVHHPLLCSALSCDVSSFFFFINCGL